MAGHSSECGCLVLLHDLVVQDTAVKRGLQSDLRTSESPVTLYSLCKLSITGIGTVNLCLQIAVIRNGGQALTMQLEIEAKTYLTFCCNSLTRSFAP